jgi:hypothetical protein
MTKQYIEYVIWGVAPKDQNKPEYLQESILRDVMDSESNRPITSKMIAKYFAVLHKEAGATNVRIQAIPFHKGCESELAKQFTRG